MKKRTIRYLCGLVILLLCTQLHLSSYGQSATGATGIVNDDNNRPLAGVSVEAKTNGLVVKRTTTDSLGKFVFAGIRAGSYDFSFTLVGHQPQTVTGYTLKEGGTVSILISMVGIANTLSDLVIVGYGAQKKANLTGAVATVSAKALQDRPLTNIAQGLQGLVPNLNVSFASGAPGPQGATFNIRGTNSINDASPLVLVDGVQMSPNLIDPSDVESVTVLKDAASSAIYGGRAAFGVILITTKKAAKGTTSLTYSGTFTMTTPTRQTKIVNSLDYIRMLNEAARTGQMSGSGTATLFTETDSLLALAYYNDPKNNSPVYVDPGSPNRYRYVGNTDWVKEIYPDWASMQQHNLTLSGSANKTAYTVALGYFTQDGLIAKIANQRYNRLNPSVKVSSDVTDWLNVSATALVNHYDLNMPTPVNGSDNSWGFLTNLRPLMPVKHPDGNYSGQGSFTNPISVMAQNGRTKTNVNDWWLTGRLVLTPIKNVSMTADYTWNSYNSFTSKQSKEFTEYGVNSAALGSFPNTLPASLTESYSNDNYYALNLYADYQNTFAKKHYVKALIGYNQELKQPKSVSTSVKNLIDQETPAINLNNDTKPTVGGSQSEWAVAGTFFRVNYVYDEKYLLEINGRYDGSSRFARGNRYYFSPSVSAGWRISKEKFFEPLTSVVSNLKIRGSYGTLANQAVSGYYPYIATMTSGTVSYLFLDQLGRTVNPPGLVSSNFTWEKVTSTNIGIDFGFLRERLSGSFDWYKRATKDMVVSGSPLPAVLGTSAPNQNAADLENKGFELSITWKDRINDKIAYSIGGGLSDYTTTITKYKLNPKKTIGSYYEGQTLGEIWGYETVGYFKTDADAAAVDQSKIWGGTWLAGDIQYKDLDKSGAITAGSSTVDDPGDRKIIGNSTPRYRYNINASVSYKGFELVIFMQGVGKRDVWLGDDLSFRTFVSEYSVPHIYAKDYWRPDNTNAYFPRLRIGGGNYVAQTRYLQNAAYLRMKELSLSYSFPKELLSKIKLNRARVYVTGQNLFEFTKMFKSIDPEFTSYNVYPLSRAVAFGLQLGL